MTLNTILFGVFFLAMGAGCSYRSIICSMRGAIYSRLYQDKPHALRWFKFTLAWSFLSAVCYGAVGMVFTS
jgi:hypothetical protein